MRLTGIPYSFATWRVNPAELIKRATHSNDPQYFGEQKHRAHEVVLFMTRLGLRPLTMRALRAAYKNTGYKPIGFGYFTIALLKGGDVTKIYEFSIRCTDSEKQALVASLQERIVLAEKYLGGFVAPTRVGIEQHPFLGGTCVVLRQNYVKGMALSKKPYAKYLTKEQRKNFRKLLGLAEKLFEDTGYLLDVNGRNIIAHGTTVTVVDTILMGKVDVVMRPVTVRILKNELKQLDAEFLA
jgi:hypothetical protein